MVATPTTGNRLLSPPRLTGDAQRDQQALLRYLQDLYSSIAVGTNIQGVLDDHETRIAELEARVYALENP